MAVQGKVSKTKTTSKLAALKAFLTGRKVDTESPVKSHKGAKKGSTSTVAKNKAKKPTSKAKNAKAKGAPAKAQSVAKMAKAAKKNVKLSAKADEKKVKKAAAEIKASTKKALKEATDKSKPQGKSAALSAYAPPQTNKAGEAICREVGCERLATTAHYCRACYIQNWKKIKRKELILKEGKLNHYIEELVSKYPEKYIDAIRQDLADDKEFNKVIHDLELDESGDDFENEGDSLDSLIGNIRRDMDDEGESY